MHVIGATLLAVQRDSGSTRRSAAANALTKNAQMEKYWIKILVNASVLVSFIALGQNCLIAIHANASAQVIKTVQHRLCTARNSVDVYAQNNNTVLLEKFSVIGAVGVCVFIRETAQNHKYSIIRLVNANALLLSCVSVHKCSTAIPATVNAPTSISHVNILHRNLIQTLANVNAQTDLRNVLEAKSLMIIPACASVLNQSQHAQKLKGLTVSLVAVNVPTDHLDVLMVKYLMMIFVVVDVLKFSNAQEVKSLTIIPVNASVLNQSQHVQKLKDSTILLVPVNVPTDQPNALMVKYLMMIPVSVDVPKFSNVSEVKNLMIVLVIVSVLNQNQPVLKLKDSMIIRVNVSAPTLQNAKETQFLTNTLVSVNAFILRPATSRKNLTQFNAHVAAPINQIIVLTLHKFLMSVHVAVDAPRS